MISNYAVISLKFIIGNKNEIIKLPFQGIWTLCVYVCVQ